MGKTTFINTLFHSELLEKKQQKTPEKTVQISAHDFGIVVLLYLLVFLNSIIELEENGVLLHLTVVDTPGFGDAVNREQE